MFVVTKGQKERVLFDQDIQLFLLLHVWKELQISICVESFWCDKWKMRENFERLVFATVFFVLVICLLVCIIVKNLFLLFRAALLL